MPCVTSRFPQCLFFLDLLQQAEFREVRCLPASVPPRSDGGLSPFPQSLQNPQTVALLRDQQIMHWQHYFNRQRPMREAALPAEVPVAAPAGAGSADVPTE